MEENNNQQKPHWKTYLTKIRNDLENIRTRNPKFFDAAATIIQVMWTLANTFWNSAILNNAVLTACITLATCGVLCLSQWVLLTNRREREVAEQKRLSECEIAEQKRLSKCEIAKQKRLSEHQATEFTRKLQVIAEDTDVNSLEMMSFAHIVAHEIKMNISKMPNQSIEITRNSIPDFLVNTLNDLERILSNHYGEKICASIKLCNTQNTLKTFARGQNNVTCRGGIKKVRIQNTKPIKIGDNYAYDTILKRKFQYFAEGDLTNLSEKEKDDDKFFCEYGDKWKSLFRSSIIIPIRCQILARHSEEYRMLGLICIDSKIVQPEWNRKKDSYAYHTMAFVADVLYSLIESYIIAQQMSRRVIR